MSLRFNYITNPYFMENSRRSMGIQFPLHKKTNNDMYIILKSITRENRPKKKKTFSRYYNYFLIFFSNVYFFLNVVLEISRNITINCK